MDFGEEQSQKLRKGEGACSDAKLVSVSESKTALF